MVLTESTCHPVLASFDSLHGFNGGMYFGGSFMSSDDRNPRWMLGLETLRCLRASQDPRQAPSNVQVRQDTRRCPDPVCTCFPSSCTSVYGSGWPPRFFSWSLLFLLFLHIIPNTSIPWVLSGRACRMGLSTAEANSFKNWLDLQRNL